MAPTDGAQLGLGGSDHLWRLGREILQRVLHLAGRDQPLTEFAIDPAAERLAATHHRLVAKDVRGDQFGAAGLIEADSSCSPSALRSSPLLAPISGFRGLFPRRPILVVTPSARGANLGEGGIGGGGVSRFRRHDKLVGGGRELRGGGGEAGAVFPGCGKHF